ncbi:MAG: SpoVG family protein [Ruminococcus sp.]|uniref:SpoVG family protein n=1 Tax=Ruminococcus sp. TaxID=41978 RepID=UPI0025CD45EF|nr:SpoVG family protein [Ruminococcus sp.]MCR5540815.1 SpoVG family protein [Ruminococcus sp.]
MKINANINRIIDKADSSVKAFASASFDGYFAVHGIKVCEGEKGLFISMPSTSYSNQNGEKKYKDIFHPITKEAREALNTAVIMAYNAELAQSQGSDIVVQDSPGEETAEQSMDASGPMMPL